MKIGILTSSRADYGIYAPLLKEINADPCFDLQLLVFGTHLSDKFGFTINQIQSDNYKIGLKAITFPDFDTPEAIICSITKTLIEFANHWNNEKYDLIFALGDRYEMFAAVTSTVPYNIPIAHIHGGETTLGAIDNVFRHSITLMSELHFTICDEYKKRVIEIKGSKENVYNVGALSIDALTQMKFLTIKEFYEIYKIDLSNPTILFTFHPETVSYQRNETYIKTLIIVLDDLSKRYQIVITMPNADTKGNLIREHLKNFIKKTPNTFGIETFGSLGYLSCMKYCEFMLGNSSSGFVEASWFPKSVINIGDRQQGRIQTPNIISCSINEREIMQSINRIKKENPIYDKKIYGDGHTAKKIISLLKNYHNRL